MNTYKEQEYDEYDNYDKYEDILFKSKQKGGSGGKCKQNKVSCYSSKHVRIQQSKIYSKK
jgi:hypothetical protein